MYTCDNHWSGTPAEMWRYTLRLDGFVSLHAGAKEKTVVTKPFIYDGSELRINFATSAWGGMTFALTDTDGTRYESCEIFGDSVGRRVCFNDTDAVSKLSGKPVTLEVRQPLSKS